MKGRAGAAAAALAALLVLSGCTTVDEAPDAETLPDGVTVSFTQLRSDVAARQGQVEVTNATEDPIEVGAVAITDPRFDGAAERVLEGRTSRLAPGMSVGIRVQLPPMRCEVDEGEMVARLELGAPGADPEIAQAPLPDPLEVIGPLHARECLAQKLMDAATVGFADFDPSPPGEPAALTLAIAPTGRAAARIDGIQTTNLLTFADAADGTLDTYPIDVAVTQSETDPVEVRLPLLPLRCDPHAVQEDKRGTIFDLEVVVDGEPAEIELAASEELRGRMLTWVADWCGFGG